VNDKPGKDESMDERIERLEEMRERERSGDLTKDDYEHLERDLEHAEQLLQDLHRKADRIRRTRRTSRLLLAFWACLGIIVVATCGIVLIVAAILIAEILFAWPNGIIGTRP